MKVGEILACSFQNWYKKFEDITTTSVVLPIPPEFLSYLQENGTLVLPEECYIKPNDTEDSNESWEEDEQETDVAVATAPNLDDFSQKIRHAIKRLGGKAFPKLNWSSPKDASWISFNRTLACSNPGDVYLLLKSSDFVSHDLTCPFKDCEDQCDSGLEKVDYCLVLRKWEEVNPADEFRCFVKDRELVGISQRDVSQYYSSIHKENDCIVDDVTIFWEMHIRNYFPLLSYVFDVHRPRDGEVSLIDFGPYGATTDSLMFSWEELNRDFNTRECHRIFIGTEMDSNRLAEEREEEEEGNSEGGGATELRYITNATGVQPSPYMRYGLPIDIVDLSTGEDPSKLADFLQMRIQKSGDCDNSSDDDDDRGDESSLSAPSSSSS